MMCVATPGGGTLSFNLPGPPPPAVRVALKDGTQHHLVTNLDTVILEPDERRVLLLWRAHLALRSGPHDLVAIEVSSEAPVR